MNYKKWLTNLLVICSTLLAPTVWAAGSGKVQIEHIYPPNKLFFYTDSHTNPPECNTHTAISSGAKRWVIDISTNLGKQQYSLILSAQLADKDVIIGGAGTCNTHANSEDVYWIGFPTN